MEEYINREDQLENSGTSSTERLLRKKAIFWFTILLAVIFENACRYHGFNSVVSEAASTMHGNGNLVHIVDAAIVMDIEYIDWDLWDEGNFIQFDPDFTLPCDTPDLTYGRLESPTIPQLTNMPALNSLFDHSFPKAHPHQGRERPDDVSIARQSHSLDTSHENTVLSSPGFPKSIPSLQHRAATTTAAPGDTPAADDGTTAADHKTSLFSDPVAQSYGAIQVVSHGTSDSGRILTCTEPSCQNLTFSKKDEWTKHMNKHNRPFKCTVTGCEKSFARNACRQRHLDSVHNHKAKFLCSVPECKHSRIGFARKDHLKQHMPTHETGVSSSTPVDQVSNLSDTAGVEARVEVWPPRKRVRVSDVQTEAALLVSSDAEAEIQRLKSVEKELQTEIKRLKETVDKQTDIIYSLTRRSS